MFKRPHKWPCVCQDCCAPFDPKSDFTGEPSVFRADKPKPVPDGMPLAEFCKRMMAMAAKATGKTEEQLRAMAEEMGLAEKPIRTHWSEQAQYERVPGEDDE